jgi:hypothetical protein
MFKTQATLKIHRPKEQGGSDIVFGNIAVKANGSQQYGEPVSLHTGKFEYRLTRKAALNVAQAFVDAVEASDRWRAKRAAHGE